MSWQEVCDDPSLRNLLYKIELDQYGRIVMCPTNNRRSMHKGRITIEIEKRMREGTGLLNCVIDTSMGTKVADVAWASNSFVKKYNYVTPYPVAPEICVDVMSPTIAPAATDEKIMLYLSKGAEEVWICDHRGAITFHDKTGKIAKSKRAPKFPSKI